MIQTHGSSITSAHYSRLGPQECEKIHMASLEILARIGIDVHDETALEILVKGGAKADGIRVRIPEYMVSRALATTPQKYYTVQPQGAGCYARRKLQHLLRRRFRLPEYS